jgi:hypothetical protein
VADSLCAEVGAVCRAVAGPVDFVLVGTELKPQGEEGREALRALFERLAELEVGSASVFLDNVLTKMQLARLAGGTRLERQLRYRPISDLRPEEMWPLQAD